MIGYGFMGRAHSNAYRQVNQFFDLDYRPVMKVACARDAGKLAKFAENWGWESTETDWRKVIERKDVDAIDIGSPNNTHKEITLAAAAAGKMVLCEKPLAMDLAEASAMTEAVERAGVPNYVWFNYRRVPAITLAKQIVDEGRLGRVFHYRACYLQDWTISPDLPQGGQTLWRLDKEVAGSGVTGDLISHSVDTAIWLNGPVHQGRRRHRDLHQGTPAPGRGRDEEGGHDRRRLPVPLPVRQRLARHVRVDPLCARPEEQERLRDQRRERLDRLRPRGPAPAPVLRPHRPRPPARLALDPRHGVRASRT